MPCRARSLIETLPHALTGKTTLLKLLVGDLQPIEGVGEVWKHHNLRVAYIAQHSMHHLEDHVESSPLAYIQDRFYLGRDKELAKLATLALDDSERELMTQRGEIEEVIGRAERGSKLWYEVQKVGRKKDDTVWEPLEFLIKMSPYVMKLVKNYVRALDLPPPTSPHSPAPGREDEGDGIRRRHPPVDGGGGEAPPGRLWDQRGPCGGQDQAYVWRPKVAPRSGRGHVEQAAHHRAG